MNNVAARHEAIQKIERDMITLAQLFQDLETAVIEQEPMVEQIEQKGEEVHDNVQKANVEIDGAIVKARSRNRKKWICLGISVVIVIIAIIVIIVVLKNAGVIG
jgi:syntaxin 1B/2/3